MSIKDVERIDEQGMKAWDTHDPDAFAELFANKFEWNDTTVPEPIRTKEGVREYMQTWLTAFPDMRVRQTNRVTNEDSVGVEIEFTGTNKGPLNMAGREIPPTKKKVVAHGTYFARIKNGKIVEFHSHPDIAEMMMQLGLMAAV
jgi:steroid delta-isomerase-like uncharacterized protein